MCRVKIAPSGIQTRILGTLTLELGALPACPLQQARTLAFGLSKVIALTFLYQILVQKQT